MTTSIVLRNRQILALAIVSLALAFFIPGGVSAAGKASAAAKPEQAQQAGRLIIARSANLGSSVVGLSIDGKEAATVNFGGTYDAPLAAGPHTITVIPVPNLEHAQPNSIQVTVQPGQTYKFTAKRSDVSLVLK